MIVTKGKLDKLKLDLSNKIWATANINLPYNFNSDPDSAITQLKYAIQVTIATTVETAFDELLDNLYTQEDFEKDITS